MPAHMKQALIHVYNSVDGNPIEKPFRVMLENAESTIKYKKKEYEKEIASGIPICIEYDIVSFVSKHSWTGKCVKQLNGKHPEIK